MRCEASALLECGGRAQASRPSASLRGDTAFGLSAGGCATRLPAEHSQSGVAARGLALPPHSKGSGSRGRYSRVVTKAMIARTPSAKMGTATGHIVMRQRCDLRARLNSRAIRYFSRRRDPWPAAACCRCAEAAAGCGWGGLRAAGSKRPPPQRQQAAAVHVQARSASRSARRPRAALLSKGSRRTSRRQ